MGECLLCKRDRKWCGEVISWLNGGSCGDVGSLCAAVAWGMAVFGMKPECQKGRHDNVIDEHWTLRQRQNRSRSRTWVE